MLGKYSSTQLHPLEKYLKACSENVNNEDTVSFLTFSLAYQLPVRASIHRSPWFHSLVSRDPPWVFLRLVKDVWFSSEGLV